MRKYMLIIGVLMLLATSLAEAGVNLVTVITGENPSEEFKQFFLDFDSAFRKAYGKESSRAMVTHEFIMLESKGPVGWDIIIHPWVGMKYLDRLDDKEFQEFTWRVDGKLLRDAVTRRKKAQEAAKWLLQKSKRLDALYLESIREEDAVKRAVGTPNI